MKALQVEGETISYIPPGATEARYYAQVGVLSKVVGSKQKRTRLRRCATAGDSILLLLLRSSPVWCRRAVNQAHHCISLLISLLAYGRPRF